MFKVLQPRAEQALINRQCGEAKRLFQQLAGLDLCNIAPREQALLKSKERVSECERINCFTTARDKAFANSENREWKDAYDAYQQAYDCAEESQKARIKKIMDDMECDAYPDRCQKGNVSVSLQPTGRVGVNSPRYFDDGLLKETNYGPFVSTGLQLTFLSYLNPLDVVIGAEYFRTKYSALGTKQGQSQSAGGFRGGRGGSVGGFETAQDQNRREPASTLSERGHRTAAAFWLLFAQSSRLRSNQ